MANFFFFLMVIFYYRRVERKVIVEANFNKLIDENLPKIRGSIIASGMDPLEMDDMLIPVTGLVRFFILNNYYLVFKFQIFKKQI